MPQGPSRALSFDEAEAIGIDATGRTDMPEGWGAPGMAHPLPAPTERNGGAHRIVTTKTHDYSGQHQITNAPGSREQHAAFQGPVQPVEQRLDPNSLNVANGIPGLTAEGWAVAGRLNKANTEYFRKHGHGI